MNARRIIAAAVTAAALLAVNIGVAESASAGTAWGFAGKDAKVQTTKVQTSGTAWG
jgi:hypothetical protein